MTPAARPVQSRAEVLDMIAAHTPELRTLGVSALWVVSSAARDALRPGSDVDVLVELGRPLGLEFFEIAPRLEQWLGRRVDLGTRQGLHERVRVQMEREAVRAAEHSSWPDS